MPESKLSTEIYLKRSRARTFIEKEVKIQVNRILIRYLTILGITTVVAIPVAVSGIYISAKSAATSIAEMTAKAKVDESIAGNKAVLDRLTNSILEKTRIAEEAQAKAAVLEYKLQNIDQNTNALQASLDVILRDKAKIPELAKLLQILHDDPQASQFANLAREWSDAKPLMANLKLISDMVEVRNGSIILKVSDKTVHGRYQIESSGSVVWVYGRDDSDNSNAGVSAKVLFESPDRQFPAAPAKR